MSEQERDIKHQAILWQEEVEHLERTLYNTQKLLAGARAKYNFYIERLLRFNTPWGNPAEVCTAALAHDQDTSPTTSARPSDRDQGTLQEEF